jgi:hypothetical protein
LTFGTPVIILTLFGTTVGLKVLHLPLTPPPTTVKLEDAWIEITGSLLSVRSDKDAFVVYRKVVGPHLATWIGLYRTAREIGYDRSGGFYGAGAWLIDCAVDANLLRTVINNLADQIRSVAMDGDRFTQCILDARASFVQPAQTTELVATLSRVSAGCTPAGGNAFVMGGTNPTEVIEWAQRGMSASAFSKVVVGAPDHAPAGGVGSSTQLFPSLSLAIEGAYRRDVTAIRNELELTKVQAQKFHANLAVVQEENKSLHEKLESTLHSLDKERDHVHYLKSQAPVITNPIARDNRQSPTYHPKEQNNRYIQDSGQLTEETASLFDYIFYPLIATLILFIGIVIGYLLSPYLNKNAMPQNGGASIHKPSEDFDLKKDSDSQDKPSDSYPATSPSVAGPESDSTQRTDPTTKEQPKESETNAKNQSQRGNTPVPNAKVSPSTAPKPGAVPAGKTPKN